MRQTVSAYIRFFVLLVALVCSGCNDSDSVGPGPSANQAPPPTPGNLTRLLEPHALTVTVVLPPGVNAALNTLKVVNSAGSFPVDSSGHAQVTYFNDGHQFATVTLADGTPLLMAFLGSQQAEISAVTTAQVLVYFRLGGWALTDSAQVALSNALTPTVVQSVTDVLLSLYASSGSALTAHSADLTAALNALASTLPSQPLARAIIDPTGDQSGIGVETTPDDANIIVTNLGHRRAFAYVEQTAFTRPQGVSQALPQPREVANVSISPTVGVHSLFGTIADLLTGTVAFSRVDSDPIPAPVVDDKGRTDAANVTHAHYVVRVIGPGSIGPTFALSEDQEKKLKVLNQEALWIDCVLPVLSNILLPHLGGKEKLKAFEAALGDHIPDLIAAAGTAYSTGFEKWEAGDYQGAIADLLQGFLGGNTTRLFINTMTVVVAQAVGENTAAMIDLTQIFGRTVVLADAILTSVDLVVTYFDYQSSIQGVSFDVEVGGGKVTLSPRTSTIDNLTLLDLRAKVQDAPESVIYSWTLLTAPTGTQIRSTTAGGDPLTGNTFNTTSPVVTLIPGTQVGLARIQVEAFAVNASTRVRIDSDIANVTIKEPKIELDPRTRSVKTGENATFQVKIPDTLNVNPSLATFDWSTTGKYGSFAGGSKSTRVFGPNGLQIEYHCDAPPESSGSDQVSVDVLVINPNTNQLESMGTASATVKVNEEEPSVIFGSAYGQASYSTSGNYAHTHGEAGWIIPIPEGDFTKLEVHIYNWHDPGTGAEDLKFTIDPQSPGEFGPRTLTLKDSLAPILDQNGLTDEGYVVVGDIGVASGDSVYVKSWTGFNGDTPTYLATAPSPGALLDRVSPSTVEVTIFRP